jgi:hypothetical protein
MSPEVSERSFEEASCRRGVRANGPGLGTCMRIIADGLPSHLREI